MQKDVHCKIKVKIFPQSESSPHHLCRKIKVKRFIARPESGGQNSDSQVNPGTREGVAVKILFKVGLIFSRQSQISNLYAKRAHQIEAIATQV